GTADFVVAKHNIAMNSVDLDRGVRFAALSGGPIVQNPISLKDVSGCAHRLVLVSKQNPVRGIVGDGVLEKQIVRVLVPNGNACAMVAPNLVFREQAVLNAPTD